MKIVRLTLALLVAVACAGCGSLLPRSSSDTPSPFATFADAQAAAERIVPFRTRVDDLAALGFDPAQGHNVTLIPYPDIVARLAPYGGVPLDSLDAGVRECILVRSACTAVRTQMHWRAQRAASDWTALRAQVTSWQASLQLQWSASEIDAVAGYLNDTIYRHPRSQAVGAASMIERTEP